MDRDFIVDDSENDSDDVVYGTQVEHEIEPQTHDLIESHSEENRSLPDTTPEFDVTKNCARSHDGSETIPKF